MAAPPPKPKSFVASVNKKFGQVVQLTAELTGKASKSDLDEDFKQLQNSYDKKKTYVETATTSTRGLLVGAHVKGSEKQTTLCAVLGHDLVSAGSELPEESNLGAALVKAGEALQKAGDLTLDMETKVREGYLNPLTALQDKEIKEITHQKKKLESRRLDYDAKRNAFEKSKKPEAETEVNASKAKYEETIQTLRELMTSLTTNEDAELDQLAELVDGLRWYHESCLAVFNNLNDTLKNPAIRGTRVIAPPPTPKQSAWSSSSSTSSPNLNANAGGDDDTEGASSPAAVSAAAGTDDNPFLDEGAAPSSKPAPIKPKPSPGVGGAVSGVFSKVSSGLDKLKSGKKEETRPVISVVGAEPMGGPPKPAKEDEPTSPLAASPVVTAASTPAQNLMDTPVPKPRTKPAEAAPKYQALFDFVPDQDDELPFKKGDTITLVKKVDDNWWIGEFGGKKGLFPSNFVGPL